LLFITSCSNHDSTIDTYISFDTEEVEDTEEDESNEENEDEDEESDGNENDEDNEDIVKLPKRTGDRPITTLNIPHIQIGVEVVTEINEELFRRVYSIAGIENRPSVIAGWRSLWLSKKVTIAQPSAIIDQREFGHIHDDGSLHIFLEPSRSDEAVETCWAVFHPFQVQNLEG
jgi:hypothetical protein